MPGSVRENDSLVLEFVSDNGIRRVLDIGAGQGTYSDLLRRHVQTIDAIEVWRPYIDEFNLNAKYDTLIEADARSAIKEVSKDYDLVIFGDVLEHMPKQDSLQLWYDASMVSTWGLISVPIIHYPQGAEFGNPYEVHHQEHLHPEDIERDYGPFDVSKVYNITGTFIKRFKDNA